MADFISVLPSVILLWKKVIILVTRTRFFMSYNSFFEDASMEFPIKEVRNVTKKF